jgi:hypothetical protein
MGVIPCGKFLGTIIFGATGQKEEKTAQALEWEVGFLNPRQGAVAWGKISIFPGLALTYG